MNFFFSFLLGFSAPCRRKGLWRAGNSLTKKAAQGTPELEVELPPPPAPNPSLGLCGVSGGHLQVGSIQPAEVKVPGHRVSENQEENPLSLAPETPFQAFLS